LTNRSQRSNLKSQYEERIPNGIQLFKIILEELPVIPLDSIVSHTIANNEHVKIILFGFAAGQELSEHTSSMPAILEVIRGKGQLTIGDDHHSADVGTWIYLPPNLKHSLIAETEVAMLLYLLK
jgi:quercetin dioxygenase-like cupin family protein